MNATQPAFDLIIRGGQVLDGSGGPPLRADVGLCGDRIAAVGALDGAESAASLDAAGLVVAPGFIDVHSHDDQAVFGWAESEAKLSQGVTSVVVGNCGISLAPLSLAGDPPPPLNLLGGRSRFRFDRFGAYVEALREAPLPLNVAALVGHGTLRVRNLDDYARAASKGEIGAMERDVAAAMDAGAVGLSCGLSYPTNRGAGTDEVVALARAAAGAGGRLAMHIRDEYDGVADAVREALQCAARSGATLVLSHQKVAGKANQGRSAELLELYRREGAGLPLAIDTYPYTAGSSVLDPVSVSHSRKVLVAWSQPHPEMNGSTLDAVCALWGCAQDEAIDRLQPAGAVYFHMDEADVSRFLAFERCMVGSDGLPNDLHPHPRLWGAFARVLGEYSRERGLFPLQEAVRKMTALPAEVFGLAGRGRVREGGWADLVLFDPRKVRDAATYEEPRRRAEGIAKVFVNGRQAWPMPAAGSGCWGRFLPGCGRT
jgi:N-acyl-D-amino-acid deacylase